MRSIQPRCSLVLQSPTTSKLKTRQIPLNPLLSPLVTALTGCLRHPMRRQLHRLALRVLLILLVYRLIQHVRGKVSPLQLLEV